MAIYCVSDVHIKKDEDEASCLFCRFLDLAKPSDTIVLLGDIFDLVVGDHHDWIKKFPQAFNKLSEVSKKVKIFYLEGNHDFHMKEIFDHPKLSRVTHVNGDLVLLSGDKSVRFSHGDDVEIENGNYRRYKKIIKSRFIGLLAREYVPVRHIAAIGEFASKESAKRSKRYEVSPEQMQRVKEKFRKSAVAYYEKNTNFDLLVCGHSHVKDFWQYDNKFLYMNNGYFLAEKTCAVIENGTGYFKEVN